MTTCLHISKSGITCDNKKILGTNFCYLKSHHSNQKEYQDCVETLYQNYVSQTIDSKNFQVIDVIGDGACLYRCFTVHLLKNLKTLSKTNHEIYSDFMEITNEFFQLKMENNTVKIDDWSQEEYQSKIQEIIEQKMLETNYMFVNKLAKYLQVKIKDWLVSNKSMPIEELGGFTLEHLVENCHDITLEQYNVLYEIFAGDLDYIMIQQDDSDESIGVKEDVSNQSRSNGGKMQKLNIPDRWGSTSETYGFSGLCHINVNVFVIKRFDRKSCGIILGKKIVKSSRMELYQRVALRSFGETVSKDLDVLLIERKGFPHYQYLDKNNISN